MDLSELGPRSERLAVSGALIGAPLAFLVGQVLLARMPREQTLLATLNAQPDVWLLSHGLLVVWLVLLVPVIWGIGQLLGPRGTFYRLTGSVLAVVGVAIITLMTGVDFVLGALAPLDARLGLADVLQQITTGVIRPLDQFDIALPAGLVVLTLGLYRTRGAPQWIVLLILIGLAIPGTTELRVLAGIVQWIGLSCLGVVVGRTPSRFGSPANSGYRYTHAVAGALVAGVLFLPGALVSVERFVLGFVVWAGLTLPELRDQWAVWQQGQGEP